MKISVYDHRGNSMTDEAALALLATVLNRDDQPAMRTESQVSRSLWAKGERFSICVDATKESTDGQ